MKIALHQFLRTKISILISMIVTMGSLSLVGCDAPEASSLTHPPVKGIFPIFISIPGNHLGDGKIYKVPEPEDLGAQAIPELVLEGLDYPMGIQVLADNAGFFYTEALTGTSGRVSKYTDAETPTEEIVTGLNEPVGVIQDTAEQLFVIERAGGTLSRIDGALPVAINSELSSPNSLTRDSSDAMYVVEQGLSQLTKILSNGETEIISSDLEKPVGGGAGLLGATASLVQGAGLTTGKVIVTRSDESTQDYLTRLVKPTALAWEDGTVLLVAEGAPTFQIIQYSLVTKSKNVIASFDGEIATLAMTPLQ